MKTIFSTILILTFAFVAFAQVQSQKELSNIEKFSAKSGSLIEKQFIDVGEVKGVSVQVLIVSDMMSNTKISGVRLSRYSFDRYSTDEKVAFLDQDEIEGFIKSIEILKSKVFNTTRPNYTEVIYTSRSGFSAGGFYYQNKWIGFMRLERFDSKARVDLAPEDFEELGKFLVLAKYKML